MLYNLRCSTHVKIVKDGIRLILAETNNALGHTLVDEDSLPAGDLSHEYHISAEITGSR
jgi:hypothetical protein